MPISDVVQVSVTTSTAGLTRVGFGKPLVMARNVPFTETARSYTRVSDMLSDGFASTHPAVLAVTALFAQTPRPVSALVGRQDSTPTVQKIVLSPVVKNSTAYAVKINSTTFTYTSDASALDSEISAGLQALIAAGSEPVTATDLTGTLKIESNTAGTIFSLEVDRTLLTQSDNTATHEWLVSDPVADLTAIRNVDDSFYSIHPTEVGHADILALAAAVEGITDPPKIMVAASANDDIYGAGSTDLATLLRNNNYKRTILMHHPKNHQYAGAAWAGRMLTTVPGSATWKFKTLGGVSSTSYTSTEIGNMDGKRVNYFTNIAGLALTAQGTTSRTETWFADVTRLEDWIRVRIGEEVFANIKKVDKIPFTDDGVAIIESAIRGVLAEGVSNGGLAITPSPTVIVPKVSAVSVIDKSNRLLPDVEFEATLAGAVHKVIIRGVVSV